MAALSFILILIATFLNIVSKTAAAAVDVMVVLGDRYECWYARVPRGYFLNCPWRETLREVWTQGFRNGL